MTGHERKNIAVKGDSSMSQSRKLTNKMILWDKFNCSRVAGGSEPLEGRQERKAKLRLSRVCTFSVMGRLNHSLVIQTEQWQYMGDLWKGEG